METQTKSKKKYIEAWNNYIDALNSLRWVHSAELSAEVETTINKMRELVVRVAEDKGLK
jgi:hypothetical protein